MNGERQTGARRPTRAARQGHLAMLVFSGLVAGSFSLGGLVATEIPPAAITVVRFLLAAALVGGLAWATGGLTRAAAAAPWRYAVVGGLYSIYFVTMFEGLKTAPPVSAAAVFTLTPVMAAGFGWLVMRQRSTSRTGLALALGGIGALWVIFRADLSALGAFEIGRGEAIYFWGCVAHAAYPPLVARFNRGEAPLAFAFFTLLAGAVLVSIWGWRDLLVTDWRNLSPLVWTTIVYVALAATAATLLLVRFAALRLPAAKVMAYTYLVPAWVVLWQMGLGQPLPPPLVFAGVGMTLVALALLLREEAA